MKSLKITLPLALALLFSSCLEEVESGAPTAEGEEANNEGENCGDGICAASEVGSCDADCTPTAGVCGNGFCGQDETPESCPADCASIEEGDNNADANTPCVYPEAGPQVVFNEAMPKLSWQGVYNGNGDQLDYSMESFHCDAEYDAYDTILFVVTAEWCPACPDYIRHVHTQAGTLKNNRMQIVFVDAEQNDSSPSTHTTTQEHISRLIDGNTGLRIGDGETQPSPLQITGSPIVQAFPSAFVVRRSDMKVIADQGRAEFILPLVDIAQNPNADWSDPANGGGPGTVEPNCGEEHEETYEPNDDPAQAPTITEGSFEGGICAPAPDYYRIEHDGPWTLSIDFSHDEGDLDLFFWDFDKNEPDQQTGSASLSDGESLSGNGPATLMIYGYEFATTTYSLTLTYE